MTPLPFVPQTFRPPQLLANPQVQTVLPYYIRNGQGVVLRRERLTTPDNDFLDLDFAATAPEKLPKSGVPLVLLIHGLEGSSKSGYIYETIRQLSARGLDAVALNLRGCSGEPNRQPRAYHSGETSDLTFVIQWLSGKFPNRPLSAVGFSLGANMLLKYLGEKGLNTLLKFAVVVSPPFDLGRGSDLMALGFNKVYTNTFLRRLQRKTAVKANQYRDLVDMSTVMSAKTLREFDNAFVAPVYGFRDADDYYSQSSSGPFVSGIRIPTLIIRSKDDPFFDPSDIPYNAIKSNPCITPAITRYGGHVGFVEGWNRYYAEREAARFLAREWNTDNSNLH